MKNMFLSRKEKKKEEAAPQGGGISRALGKVSFEGFDWWLFTLMLIILAIGLIMVLSASGIVAEQVNGDKYYFFKRQLIFACGGGLVLWGAALMPRSWLYKLQYPAIFLSLFLLLLTLSPLTPSINGAKRWIPLGPVNLQPMEFVKISLALYLAYFMSSKQALVKTFSRGVIPPFAVTGLFCGLLLLQPDFGSAVVVASILFFMCLAGGTRFIYLFFAMILACAGAMALAILEPYRLRRLLAFLDPFADPTDTGYHLVQSLLAIGSGQLTGQGYLNGTQTQASYSAALPARQTVFIFSVCGEELGMVGCLLLLLVLALIILRCYWVGRNASSPFSAYVSMGIAGMLLAQVFFNVGMCLYILPVMGLTLPFFSYGGSSIITLYTAMGIVSSIRARTLPSWLRDRNQL